jgi:carbon monoxide dehydrogenase subunit G
MKIDNEFTVHVPIERAWEVLTDLEGIAPCLPGAQLTGVEGDVYSGKVKIKVGPVVSEYAGTAQFIEKDDANYHAVIDAKGKDSRGAGNAAATISAQLRADGSNTVVSVSTDMTISGKIAQFGSGMIKEVSEKLLGQFAQNLEVKVLAPDVVLDEPAPEAAVTEPIPETKVADADSAPTAPTAPTPTLRTITPSAEPEALDLMSLAGSSVYKRLIPLAGGLAVVIALIIWLVNRD